MKLYSVQYLRGLAAMLVVLTHALSHPTNSHAIGSLRIGSMGITLFFVISGFIMVAISGPGAFDRWTFYKRRLLRIAPMYWLATTAVLLLSLAAPTLLRNTRFDLGEYVLSLLFVPHRRGNGEIVPLLKLGWTLNLEVFFYLCFGLLAPLAAGRRVLILAAALVGLAVLGQAVAFTNPAAASYTSIHLVSFAIGMGAGLLHLRRDGKPRGPLPGAALALAGAGLMAAGVAIDPGEPLPPAVILVHAAGSALLLTGGLLAEPWLPRWRLGALIGDASYSIYLVHMYAVAAVIIVWHRLLPQLPPGGVEAACLVAGAAAGTVAHLAAERPLLRLTTARRGAGAAGRGLSDGVPPALVPDDPLAARTR